MRWWLGALVLLGLALTLRLGGLVYAMYVFLGTLALSRYWTRRWTDAVVVHREGTVERAEMGDRSRIRLTIQNDSRRRIPWLLVEESLPASALRQSPPRLRCQGGRVAVLSLRPGETETIQYEIEFLMRGYYQMGPVLLESGDLFGLHRRYRLATEPSYVLVRPKVVALEGYDIASRRPIGEVRISHRLFEDPTRISGVRPYERGDPLNRIHWRATARMGTLHSKTYDPSCVVGATLLLDFHLQSFQSHRGVIEAADSSHGIAARAALAAARENHLEIHLAELAITTTASLANAVFELGKPIGLVTNGHDAAERIRLEGWRGHFRTRSVARLTLARNDSNERLEPLRVPTGLGTEQLNQILDTLGRLEMGDGLDFPALLHECQSRLPRDATVTAVLTRVTEETAIALGNLRRSGFAVTAILVSFDETKYHDWASPPDWAGRLLGEGIEFRHVQDEASLAELCANHFVR
jgi:uncharacterized protein (DUF58 family)